MEKRSHIEVLRAVRRIEIATRRAVTAELAGRYHSVFKGQGMAFSEVRPYTPGDDIRHIDWNVSARHQNLFIKEYTEERELTVLLLVDLSSSGEFGTRGKSKRNILAEVGAMLAFSAINNNDRVGLILFTGEVELFLPPRKGKKHVLRVIRELVEHRPTGKGTSIREALAYLSRVQKRRAVCFLLTDFLDEGWESAMKVALAKHDLVSMRILDRSELELPDLGLVSFVDAETNEVSVVDSSDPRVRELYKAARHGKLVETKKRLHQLGADLVDLRTDEDYVVPLINFFRTRSRRLRAGR